MRVDDKKYTWKDAGKNGYAPNDGCDYCGKLLNSLTVKPVRAFTFLGQVKAVFCSEDCMSQHEQLPKIEDSENKPNSFLVEKLKITCGNPRNRNDGATQTLWGDGWAMVFLRTWGDDEGRWKRCWQLIKAWKCSPQ